MCNLSEGVKEDGRIEGQIIATKKHINNLMKKKNMTFDEAVDLLGVKQDFVDIIREEMMEKEA